MIQRVSRASVHVEDREVGAVGPGLLILLGVGLDDTRENIPLLVQKIIKLRIFSDAQDKMNLSVQDIKGEILVISQFTLYADTRKGNRPSFTGAAGGDSALALYEAFVLDLRKNFQGRVDTGEFGADMKVSLVNDGPITIMLEN